jgi:hypothetical protein
VGLRHVRHQGIAAGTQQGRDKFAIRPPTKLLATDPAAV